MLRFSLPTFVLASALAFGGGCGKSDSKTSTSTDTAAPVAAKPTHVSIAKMELAKGNEVATILHGVKDEASAKAAVPELTALRDEMKKIEDQKKSLPPATPEEKKAIAALSSDQQVMGTKMMEEETRIKGLDEKISGPINNIMETFGD